MNLNDYQKRAMVTAIYNPDYKILYPTLGLMGEAGEVSEKVKKLFRDSEGKVTTEFVEEITKELGDVLWYICSLCNDLGIELEDVAQKNLTKLSSRLERNVIHGSGDNR